MIGSSFSLFALPWWPQNISSPFSSLTLMKACAPQMSQRSEAVSVGRELVSMVMNITVRPDSYFVKRAVSLFAKWQNDIQL